MIQIVNAPDYVIVPRARLKRVELVMLDLCATEVAERRRCTRLESAGVSVRGDCIEPLHFVLDLLGFPDSPEGYDREPLIDGFSEIVKTNSRREYRRYLRWLKAQKRERKDSPFPDIEP